MRLFLESFNRPMLVLASLTCVMFLLILPSLTSAQMSPSGFWAATVADRYQVTPNVVYTTVGSWEGKLDLYLPVNSKKKNTTLIWIHGGGWTQSSKEQEMLYILPYLEMGWAVVNVEYRLASVALAPAAVKDCRCALRWVKANAEKYKLDPDKLVVSGISAGGHLALMTGMLPGTAGFDGNCVEIEKDVKVAAIINWFGPSSMYDLIQGAYTLDQAVAWFGNQPNRDILAMNISPLTYTMPGLPPIITIHGDRDELIPYSQSVKFHRALTGYKVPNQLVTIRGRGHGDFKPAEWLTAYAAIRAFLVKNGVMARG